MDPIEKGEITNSSNVFKEFFEKSTIWRDIEVVATDMYEELKESIISGTIEPEGNETFDLWRGRCQGYAMIIRAIKEQLTNQGEINND